MIKLCSKCNTEKPIELFTYFTKRSKHHVWCKPCVKDYDHKRHKSQAKRIRGLKKQRRKDMRKWFLDIKSGLKCNRCSETHVACLVFHHTDPNEKEIEISNAMQRGFSKERILAEMTKCEVLCANCHAKHHFTETYRDAI